MQNKGSHLGSRCVYEICEELGKVGLKVDEDSMMVLGWFQVPRKQTASHDLKSV